MAMRKVIHIDEGKCDGCGDCVPSCAEGAIAIIDGKARLVSEVYCDGLGACLGHCPQGAITMEEREGEEFDEVKTREHLGRLQAKRAAAAPMPVVSAAHQCPGSMMRSLDRQAASPPPAAGRMQTPIPSELVNWPVQLTLVPPRAPYLWHADLLLVADCVPFAYADFHRRFLRGKPVIIGCPKLDQPQFYVQKLAEILRVAEPKSLTVIHMEVPCCSGLTHIAEHALAEAQSPIPLEDVVVSIRGEILDGEAAPGLGWHSGNRVPWHSGSS
jgi:Pyruvate/2-oxoacid:ferredoxin oxidoreductase delta subunit